MNLGILDDLEEAARAAGFDATEARRLRMMAVLRASNGARVERKPLLSPTRVAEHLEGLVALGHEEFWVLLLNSRKELIASHLVSRGGLSQCSVLPREAFAPALTHAATAVIFAHNHPSGDPMPSPDDLRLQRMLEEAGRALGIAVLDHFIVAESGAHSARSALHGWPKRDSGSAAAVQESA